MSRQLFHCAATGGCSRPAKRPAHTAPLSEELRKQMKQQIRLYSERIDGLKPTTTSIVELREKIGDILKEIAAEPGSYSAKIAQLLMLRWTRAENGENRYDKHMKDHSDAIEDLTKAWLAVINSELRDCKKIRILDLSCGTGNVLRRMLEALPDETLAKVEIVANDVSQSSTEVARTALATFNRRVRNVEFTNWDIMRELPVNANYDIVILSQTLPLICNDDALKVQRLETGLPQAEKQHTTAKRELLRTALKLVKPEKGRLWVIDEHPQIMSNTPDDFDGMVEDLLFREIFRTIEKNTLIKDLMKADPLARFVGHVETPIDRHHSMYLMEYRRNTRKAVSNRISTQTDAPSDSAEVDAKLVEAAARIHANLISRLTDLDGRTTYLDITAEPRLVIDPTFHKDNINGRPQFWNRNGNNNLVIVSDLAHLLGVEGYKSLVRNLKNSRKLDSGASILFLDTWPAPSGVNMPMSNSDARRLVMEGFDDHVFCASLKQGNRYAYLFVVTA